MVIIGMTIIIVTTKRQMFEHLRGALVGSWAFEGGTNFMGSLELKGFICYSAQPDAHSSPKL